MADVSAVTARESKRYIHVLDVPAANAADALTAVPPITQVGEHYITSDAGVLVVAAVDEATGVPTFHTP